MKKILFTIATLVLAASCIEDSRNNFMVPDSLSLVYDNLVVPVSVYSGSAKVTVQKSGMGSQEAVVSLGVSADSLASYNAKNLTAYTVLDASKYNFSASTVSFGAKDATGSITIEWTPASVLPALDGANTVIPVIITEASPLEVNPKRNMVILNIVNSKVELANVPGLVKKASEKEEEDIEVSLQVAVDNPLPMDLKVTLAVDNASIAAYNEANGTECIAAPDGYVRLQSGGYTLPAGEVDCYCDLTLKNSALFTGGKIMDFDSMVVPFKITSTSESGIVVSEKVIYLVVNSPFSRTGLYRVWGKYWKGTDGWAATLAPDLDGHDLNLAFDSAFVYIPQASADVAAIHKFDLMNGSYIGTLPTNDDMKAGDNWVSCARMMKNTDPSVNGGNDLLVVCNRTKSGQDLIFVAYVNGTDNAPVTLYKITAYRRFGDKFSVWGSYQHGCFYLRSVDDDAMTARIYLTEDAERTAGSYDHGIWQYADPFPGKLPLDDTNSIGEYTLIPGQSSIALVASASDVGLHLVEGTTEKAKYPKLARCFGFNFFQYQDQNCIAYVSLYDETKPKLVIIKAAWKTVAELKDALDKHEVLFEAPLQSKDDPDVQGLAGDDSVGDCCVRTVGDKIYIAAMAQRTGLSVFELN